MNGDGTVDPTDGALALRYLFGFRDDALTSGLDTDITAATMAAQLGTLTSSMLDVDGNGTADALTDGIVIERYLAGWTGDSLTADAIGTNATRTDSATILAFLATYMPTISGEPATVTTSSSAVTGDALLADTAVAAEQERVNTADTTTEDETTTDSLLCATAAVETIASPVSDSAESENQQLITPDPVAQTVTVGSTVAVDINYSTSPEDTTLSGLGIQLFYDSSKLTFASATNVLLYGYVQQQLLDDSSNLDNDASTDKYVLIAWAKSDNSWPGESTTTLFTVNFDSAASATGSTSLNFAPASTSIGWTLTATSAVISFKSADNSSGAISGYVYVDAAQTGEYLSDEGLAGVVIRLGGAANQTTSTNSSGYYQFANLSAGTYTVTETQPAACIDGGDNSLSVMLESGATASDKNFSEAGLKPGYIPNRVLATTSLPVGSTTWKQVIRDTLARVEAVAAASGQTASSVRVASTTSAVGDGYEMAATASPSSAVSTNPQRTTTLTTSQLAEITKAAIAQWAAAGLTAKDLAKLQSVSISITDLPNDELGWTTKNGIVIDDNAAGYGWFVDSTPNVDEGYSTGKTGQLVATDSAAANHIDLLTVIEHELGHYLGLDDVDGSYELMSGTLAKGIRRQVGTAEVDAVFASERWNEWV